MLHLFIACTTPPERGSDQPLPTDDPPSAGHPTTPNQTNGPPTSDTGTVSDTGIPQDTGTAPEPPDPVFVPTVTDETVPPAPTGFDTAAELFDEAVIQEFDLELSDASVDA